MPAPVGFHPVLDALGKAIATGEIGCGSVLLIEEVEERYGISRSVAREAVRMLESLGMIALKRRIGCIVQPRASWIVSDPRVIGWRLEGTSQGEELDQLMQLRAGIEPIAARLAALRRDEVSGKRLQELAARMLTLGRSGAGDREEFLIADIEFHTLVLTVSRNDHFGAFADVFATVLTERNHRGLLSRHPDPRAMDAHVDVAAAVAAADPDWAERAARYLVEIVSSEVLAGRADACALLA